MAPRGSLVTTSYPWAPFEAYLRRRWPDAFEQQLTANNGTGTGMRDFGHNDRMPKPSMGALIGVTDGCVRNYRCRGQISEPIADRLATRVGLHPSTIWPDWWRNA